jgi:hypothetical protein
MLRRDGSFLTLPLLFKTKKSVVENVLIMIFFTKGGMSITEKTIACLQKSREDFLNKLKITEKETRDEKFDK